jgi:squalene-associated FAD-dependent desaturase
LQRDGTSVTRVAIVGAGWSGLACAMELVRRGLRVTLLDAAPAVGGRARGLRIRIGDHDYGLDNGQHLLIGAYRETLRLMREAGVDPAAVLLRLPFEIRYPDGVVLRARRLPAPIDLAAAVLAAKGLGWRDRLQALAFTVRWRARDWRLAADMPASALYEGSPAEIVRRLWRPLCLAALNVELHDASAQMLLAVLRDAFAGGAGAADFLIPRADLSSALAAPAASWLADRGAELHLKTPALALRRNADAWRLQSRTHALDADAVVLALPPPRAAQLLDSAMQPALGPAVAQLRAVAMAPIATVYLRYPAGVRLDLPAVALLDDPDARRHGQWVFDRGWLDAANSGVLSVVISAAGNAGGLGADALVGAVAAQLTNALGLPQPLAGVAITEKRATIVPSPGLRRPPARLPLSGLYLAGDAAASDYPSTLEGSVRAGIAAAQALLGDAGGR